MRIRIMRNMGHCRKWRVRCVFSAWNVMVDLNRSMMCMRVGMVWIHTHHWMTVSTRHHRVSMNIGYVCGFALFFLAFFQGF